MGVPPILVPRPPSHRLCPLSCPHTSLTLLPRPKVYPNPSPKSGGAACPSLHSAHTDLFLHLKAPSAHWPPGTVFRERDPWCGAQALLPRRQASCAQPTAAWVSDRVLSLWPDFWVNPLLGKDVVPHVKWPLYSKSHILTARELFAFKPPKS